MFISESHLVTAALPQIDPASVDLTDGVVRLRCPNPADCSAMFAAVRESLPELERWMSWAHAAYSMEENGKFIASRDEEWRGDRHFSFGVFAANTGEFLGGAGMNFIERMRGRANLGYWIRSTACRRGYATRATKLVARFGFTTLAFTRIEIVAAIANTASLRVAEKAGAYREGVMRNGIVIHGTPTDAVLYSLLPGEV